MMDFSINIVSPITKGWFFCKNIILNDIIIMKNLISDNILCKIWILGNSENILLHVMLLILVNFKYSYIVHILTRF